MKYISRLLLLTVFCVSCFSCTTQKVLPEDYEYIQQMMKNEEYRNVVKYFETNDIKRYQMKDWYYYTYAVALYKLSPERVRYSFIFLTKAERYNKKDFAILYHVGVCYYKMGMYREALKAFTESKKYLISDYLDFQEKTDVDFWLAYLYNCIEDYENVNRILNDSSSDKSEIQYLRSIQNNEEIIEKLICDNTIPLQSKIQCLDFYFNRKDKYTNIQKYKDICLKYISEADKETTDYLRINLIYFYLALNDIAEAEKVLKKYKTYPFYNIECETDLVNENFYKVLSFYYWKKKNVSRACNSMDIYKSIHERPLNVLMEGKKYCIDYYLDYFSDCKDFLYLNKDINDL